MTRFKLNQTIFFKEFNKIKTMQFGLKRTKLNYFISKLKNKIGSVSVPFLHSRFSCTPLSDRVKWQIAIVIYELLIERCIT